MNLRTFILAIILVFFATASNTSQGPKKTKHYSKEVYELSSKINLLKDKYYLKYTDYSDLVETCDHIVKYSHYSKFNKYEISALIIKESKFNQFAFNKNDGGIGYGQITGLEKGWHCNTLFWLDDPYDKDQNIRGIYFILDRNLKSHKTKFAATKKYNGSTSKSTAYAHSIVKISNELKAVKI